MNAVNLTRADRLELLALLNREIGYVGISSAAGQRALALIAKVRLVVDETPVELLKLE